MNSNAVENIDINSIKSGVTMTLEHTKDSVMVTSDISEWVKEVHVNYSVIADADKQMEHWRKRELDAAMRCGENLVNIRQQYGKLGHGFKTFIATEFANEFSYETCLRYMKLFNGRSQLTPEINSLRKAYIHLGILKQDYAYPKPIIEDDDSISTDKPSSSNSNPDNNTGLDKIPKRILSPKRDPQNILDKLVDSHNGFLIKMPTPTTVKSEQQSFIEFMVDHNGDMLGRFPGKADYFKRLPPEKYSVLCERIKPIVDWYMGQNPNLVRSLDKNLGGVEYFSIAA